MYATNKYAHFRWISSLPPWSGTIATRFPGTVSPGNAWESIWTNYSTRGSLIGNFLFGAGPSTFSGSWSVSHWF